MERASFFPAGEGTVSARDRARICKFSELRLGESPDREPDAIADAIARHFPAQASRLRAVITRLQQLPGSGEHGGDHQPIPYALHHLQITLT